MITFFILSMLAAMFIFISASFLADTGKVVDTNMEKINAADILMIADYNEDLLSKAEEVMKGNVYLKNFEVEDMVDILCAEYDVPTDVALNDCNELAKKWIEAGLAEE